METNTNKYPFIFPLLFVVVLWAIKLYEIQNKISFSHFGIFPRSLMGFVGIFATPFIHGNLEHLINNSIPLLVLGTVVFYFYREVAFRVVGWTWVLSGFWVWLAARQSFHIGASGLIYGLSSFIFFSGIFRKYYKMIALSLLVVFLYGSMIWGIFPIENGVSWEGHLYGAIAGLILAYNYRNIGPQRKIYDWELEDDTDEEDIGISEESESNKLDYNYVYLPSNEKES